MRLFFAIIALQYVLWGDTGEIAQQANKLKNGTFTMQYFFWQSAKKNYFLASQKADKTFAIWQFTNDKSWKPIHNTKEIACDCAIGQLR